MDLTPIILGIVAINLGTLLAGTALAIHRTRREGRTDTARRGVRSIAQPVARRPF
jgi:hypothetical protein